MSGSQSKTVSMRLPVTTSSVAAELQKDMNLSSKAAVVSESIRITKQLSNILKGGGDIYVLDKNGEKVKILISSLQPT